MPVAKKNEAIRAVPYKPGAGISEVQWNQILVGLLRGNGVRGTARITGIHERTVRRLVNEGYPKQPWGATPIRVLVEQEQAKARALRAEIPADVNPAVDELTPLEAEEKARIEGVLGAATLKERKAAKEDAMSARVAEANMVRLSRTNVVLLLAAGVSLTSPAAKLAKALMARVTKIDENAEVDIPKTLHMLREIAAWMKIVVETGHKAMEMERLLLGDPTGTGQVVQDAEKMSDGEMMVSLSNAVKIYEQLGARGFRVIQGGLSKSSAPSDMGQGSAFDTAASRTTSAGPIPGAEVAKPAEPENTMQHPAYEPPKNAGT